MRLLLIFLAFIIGKQYVSCSFVVRKENWWQSTQEKWCQTLIKTAPSANQYKLHFKYLSPPDLTAAQNSQAACMEVFCSNNAQIKVKCLLREWGGVSKKIVHCRSTRKQTWHAGNGFQVIWCFSHTYTNNLDNWLTPSWLNSCVRSSLHRCDIYDLDLGLFNRQISILQRGRRPPQREMRPRC